MSIEARPEIIAAVTDIRDKYPNKWGDARVHAELVALGYDVTREESEAADRIVCRAIREQGQ